MSRYQAFIDDYPCGKVEKANFIQVYRDLYPFGDPDEFAEYLFPVFDRNMDGVIDFNDHICVLSSFTRGSFEEKYKCAQTRVTELTARLHRSLSYDCSSFRDISYV